jgi:hypothetical protein
LGVRQRFVHAAGDFTGKRRGGFKTGASGAGQIPFTCFSLTGRLLFIIIKA